MARFFWDLIWSEDEGFWYIEAYTSQGTDIKVTLPQSEFDVSATAVGMMHEHYPDAELVKVIQ